MLREDILARLAELKLKGMLAAYDEIVSLGIKRRATPEKILHELLLAEAANREACSIRYRMGQAKFPVPKDLDSFDWNALPREEPRLKSLCEGAFLAQHTNVIFVGGTGTGKTHLAIAIGRQAIRDGHRVRFYNLLHLVNRLEQEKLAGQGGRTAETLARRWSAGVWRASTSVPGRGSLGASSVISRPRWGRSCRPSARLP
jgi:DNA replication protein DnaC